MNQLPAIDFDALRILTDGDPEIESGLFKLYLESAAECLNRLRHEGGEEWSRTVHELKGASANMHMPGMVALCGQAQAETNPAMRRELVEQMEIELQRVRSASKTTNAQP